MGLLQYSHIPSLIIYKHYKKWLKVVNSSAKPMHQRGYTKKIHQYFRNDGYINQDTLMLKKLKKDQFNIYLFDDIQVDDSVRSKIFINPDLDIESISIDYEDTTELNDTTYVFQQYLRDKTNLLDMDKLPLGVLKAVYCDVLDLEEGSQASKISTREIVRRNKEFFKSYGYVNEPGQRMTQKAAHDYITRDLIDLSDEEFDQYLSDADKGKESDHDLIGEFTSRCLRENKTSAYLKKVSD